MPKKKKDDATKADVWVSMILDESGSMSGQEGDVIGSFNSYVKDVQGQPGKTYLTLTKFNDTAKLIYANRAISDVNPLDSKGYAPRGSTALLDAIGNTIHAVERDESAAEVKPKCLFVIFTDGYENASREYSREQIRTLIESKEKKDGWTFIYLGANQDAFTAGASMGVTVANSVNYSTHNTGEAMAALSASTSRLRSTRFYATMDAAFTEDEEKLLGATNDRSKWKSQSSTKP